MDDFDRLLLPENLNFAWIKAKQMIRVTDGYTYHAEVASFELNLKDELNSIREDFKNGTYRLSALLPLPRPKKIDNEECIDRQYYHVNVRDQVAWIAISNVLGPGLDQLMPPWSYGNRLYRPAWYEEHENRRSTLEIGPYRHSSGHIYRKFQHSWPLFRRHVALTARIMATGELPERDGYSEADDLALISGSKAGLLYLKPDFWSQDYNVTVSSSDLYYCSIDLKQFFPSIDRKIIGTVLLKNADLTQKNRSSFAKIIRQLLDFELNGLSFSPLELRDCEPEFSPDGEVSGLPTGLFVAGFLSNVAMFEIDQIVERKVLESKNIAHFRFVDDHTIIAKSFDELVSWVNWYARVISESEIGVSINQDKFDPKSFGEFVKINQDLKEKQSEEWKLSRSQALKDSTIDGKNPTKLLTKTLERLSAFAMTPIETLDDGEVRERFKDLEWLLLADIPDREIRADTRAAFAAGQISRIAPLLIEESDELVQVFRKLSQLKNENFRQQRKTGKRPPDNQHLVNLEQELATLRREHFKKEDKEFARCFSLLMQSFNEHTGKPRLFFRLIQFCRVTGYNGFNEIENWFSEYKGMDRRRWAEYYMGLSCQLLSGNILSAVRALNSEFSLRSEKRYAQNFLENIGNLKPSFLNIKPETERWYHEVGRNEFIVSLLSSSNEIKDLHPSLSQKLSRLAKGYGDVGFNFGDNDWKAKTGFDIGVWAHHVENGISSRNKVSSVWAAFEEEMSFEKKSDLLAIRRYPKAISHKSWEEIEKQSNTFSVNDQGWLIDFFSEFPSRLLSTKMSDESVMRPVVNALQNSKSNEMDLVQWVGFLRNVCSPFDPRAAEWTSLEIVRQLLMGAVSIDRTMMNLGNLHPRNVLIPSEWKTRFGKPSVSWEEWRNFARNSENGTIRLTEPAAQLHDYRFSPLSEGELGHDGNEREITGIGRILFGLLRQNFDSPSIWNILGNEKIQPFPTLREMEALPISSKTSLILESCLSHRSKETRLMPSAAKLFGMKLGDWPNDTELDPPRLMRAEDLIPFVEIAQTDLKRNQIAVTENQPRQLIPFNLKDFSLNLDDGAVEVENE